MDESLLEGFAFYGQLNEEEKAALQSSAREHVFPQGAEVYRGDCSGLMQVEKGRLRAYVLSDTGREITLYRLERGDVCLFSASCALRGIRFDVFVRAETDARVLLIPADAYKRVMQTSVAAAAYTNELMAERFSRVMWVLDEVLNKKFDARLAALLLQEAEFAKGDTLNITHEQIAAHLGTVREAVSRMLKYFEREGLVSLSRGTVRLLDMDDLRLLAKEQKN